MVSTIDQNFNLHARLIPEKTAGMTVKQLAGITLVDSKFSCDTFNILHITDGTKVNADSLGKALRYYQERQLDYCIWVNRENLSEKLNEAFRQAEVSRQNEEVGMILELDSYQLQEKSNHVYVRSADQADIISDYAEVVAQNWEPPDLNVLQFYQQATRAYLDPHTGISLLVYYHEGAAVSTLEFFPSNDATIGIYGFATRKKFRGLGIGSTLFTFALNYAKTAGYRQVVLQASEDGLGIYKKYGFKAVTQYYEYA